MSKTEHIHKQTHSPSPSVTQTPSSHVGRALRCVCGKGIQIVPRNDLTVGKGTAVSGCVFKWLSAVRSDIVAYLHSYDTINSHTVKHLTVKQSLGQQIKTLIGDHNDPICSHSFRRVALLGVCVGVGLGVSCICGLIRGKGVERCGMMRK